LVVFNDTKDILFEIVLNETTHILNGTTQNINETTHILNETTHIWNETNKAHLKWNN